jgi:hypothetical protein
MASFRSFSEIVSTMIQRLSLSQPNLDTKPGTVSRDLFIDLPADEIAKLYSALSLVSEKQSLATTVGRDLDRLAANFGSTRSRGSSAGGIVIFVANNLVGDIPIPNGTTVTSRSGKSFRTVGNFVMSASEKNRLAANATRMRKALNIAGLSSTYAIEVPVQAVRPGTSGNVSSLQINQTSLQGPASVINLTGMSGGSNIESDNSFRSRILSIFSGANIGTSGGYRNALLGVAGVVDAVVVEPGSSLMLRDGTETISLEDGSSRILSSGTGGKVDIYILGRKIESLSESYIFTDMSGSGDISDERNDYTLGQGNQDVTRTAEERRVMSFRNGILPAQPIDSITSIVGTQSGQLTESFVDDNGVRFGHFELKKDYNPETGGSPFGFDKAHFVSSEKIIESEPISKGPIYTYDSPSFSGIDSIDFVYMDINEIGERSSVSSSDSSFVRLNHYPVRRVSRVENKTTGEVYAVVSQNLDEDGLNSSGVIQISGRSLPTPSSILSVNYTWRKQFDKYVDFYGGGIGQFGNTNIADAIDWSPSGGIFEEESVITRSDDEISFKVDLDYSIKDVSSVFFKDTSESTISELSLDGGIKVIGIELSLSGPEISDIISIKRKSDGLELFNTEGSGGYFSSREIYLPSDSSGEIGDEVIVFFNKVEVYNLENSDGSSYRNSIILPSDSILTAEGVFGAVETAYLSEDPIYVSYTFDSKTLHPDVGISSLPIIGDDNTDRLSSSDGIGSDASSQPIFYNRDTDIEVSTISRFGPSNIAVSVSGIPTSGKIKISGTSLNGYTVSVVQGVSFDGNIVNLESEIKSIISSGRIPDDMGIARVNRVYTKNENGEIVDEFSLLGVTLMDNSFSVGLSSADSNLEAYKFVLPSNENNNEINLTSSDEVYIDFMLYNRSETEELYFAESSEKITSNRYGRIESISASSGFRNSVGAIVGSLSASFLNQPSIGEQYFVDYRFKSPKEGERLTVTYNVNRVILDATTEIERVRPITADVLIKEAQEIKVDVYGTILINDDSISNTDSIIESVSNAVSNLLTTTNLGSTIDYSDVLSTAATQSGVDSVNISVFNISELSGRKAFVRSLDNQYISPGIVSFEAISRNKFRIN